MADKLSCPYCASPQIRLWEAVQTIRIVERPGGGPGIERKGPVYRCLVCGHTFDEVEAEEGLAVDDPALLD
jgi:DNA-directed RNA polymerase subunit RPC12/RpoP